jgi:hypothetical protein
MPISGAALAFVMLGEIPTSAQVAGAVLSGIAFVERRSPIGGCDNGRAMSPDPHDWSWQSKTSDPPDDPSAGSGGARRMWVARVLIGTPVSAQTTMNEEFERQMLLQRLKSRPPQRS